ncbi:MAG: hypothetical protein WCP91_01805 [Candidatus Berkelbacteria bacterium]
MPLARLKFRTYPDRSDEYGELEHAIEMLQHLIAEHLSCTDPNGGLVADDVDIEVFEAGPLDRSKYDVELSFAAMAFPLRMADIETRCQRVFNDFVKLLPACYTKPFLWFVPAAGAVFIDKVVEIAD